MSNYIPALPYRHDLTEKFTTYIALENEKGRLKIQWQSSPHLKRNLQLYRDRHEGYSVLNQQPDAEKLLVKFWMNLVRGDRSPQAAWEPAKREELAWLHLTAYCQDACYSATRQVWAKNQEKPWQEYLYFARCWVCDRTKLEKLLLEYDSSQAALKTYLEKVLINTIKNDAKVSRFSAWRLLCKKGDRELRGALARARYGEPEISRYVAARKCFLPIYKINRLQNPSQRTDKSAARSQTLPPPDSADFDEAARHYNAHKSESSAAHEVSTGQDINGEELKLWMERCIEALQNYPKSIVPRLSIEVFEESGYEFEDSSSPGLEEIIDEPDLGQAGPGLRPEIESAFRELVHSLKPSQQEVILLYYGFRLTQKQIGAISQISQSALSRRLASFKNKFLQALLKLGQPSQRVPQYIAEWLQHHYQAPNRSDLLEVALVEAHKTLSDRDRQVLRLRYGERVASETAALQLGEEADRSLEQAIYKLEKALLQKIQKWTKEYVQLWLENFYGLIAKSACHNLQVTWIYRTEPENLDGVLAEALKIINNEK